MKIIDKVFIAFASVIQAGIATGLLWISGSQSLASVLTSPDSMLVSDPQVARLISDYKYALGFAKAIFMNVGLALICSLVLTLIVAYRQSAKP